MNKGFVQLPLETYHEYLELKKELREAERRYESLQSQIRGIYTIHTGGLITGDPLSQRLEFIVTVDRGKLTELLGGEITSKDYEVVFQFAPKNNM